MRWAVIGGMLAVLLSTVAAGEPRATVTIEAGYVRVRGEGNDLLVRRKAPVACSTLEALSAMLDRPMAAHVPVMRLVTGAPAGMIEYVFCVLREGTLVVGQQTRTRDPGSGQYRFLRGDIGRGYPVIEGTSPWTWFVAVPVSREVTVMLEIRAESDRWPIEGVSITPSVAP